MPVIRSVILREQGWNARSYDFATVLLEDLPALNTEANRRRLASKIEETIETFIREKRKLSDTKRAALRELLECE